jgi:hypothetical protein
MRHAGMPFVALFLLAGCASGGPPSVATRLDHIIFDFASSPFCDNGCLDRRYTVVSDGTVWIEEGRWHSGGAVAVRRQVEPGAPDRYTTLQSALADVRPSSDAAVGECRHYEMDLLQLEVTWVEAGRSISRTFADGCVDERPLNEAVVTALGRTGAFVED